MSGPTLVVLAAGIGSRYGGLKQIEPVGPHGEIIVDYSVYDALQSGFARVVFVLNAQIEALFRERVGQQIEQHCEVAYAIQRLDDLPAGFEVPAGRQKPWGTAHAVWSCREVVDTPFAVINADDFYGRSAFSLLGEFLASAEGRPGPGDYCMVGYRIGDTLTEHGHVSRGICAVDPGGYLVGIHERKRVQKLGRSAYYSEDGESWIRIARGSVVSMNIWGFLPGLFRELEVHLPAFLEANRGDREKAEFLLPELVGRLIRENRARVKVLPAQERWFGVTYREDLPRTVRAVRALIRRGVYPEDLWAET